MSKYDSKLVKKYLKMKLQNQFNMIPSPKCLYVDQKILSTLNYIFDFKFQKQIMGANKIIIFQIDQAAEDVSQVDNIIFFIYTGIDYMKTIASMVLHNLNEKNKKYNLFIVPRDNFLSTNELAKMNVKQKIKIKNFDFGFLPIDQNVLSLQLPLQTQDFQVQSCAIDSILRICNLNGKFTKMYGRGKDAKNILKLTEKKIQQLPDLKQQTRQSILYVFDRKVDLVTPMLTAFTYGALIDRFYGINLNRVQVPTNILHRDQKGQKTQKTWILLNNPPSTLWNQIRSMYIKQVPQYLKKLSDQLRQKMTKLKKQAKGLTDLNNINDTLSGQYMIIQDHRGIAAEILMKLNQFYIMNSFTFESQIIQPQASFSSHISQIELLTVFMQSDQILRLISLSSWCNSNGNFFEKYRKAITEIIVNNYSVKDLIRLKTCQEKGLFNRSKLSRWKQFVEKLDLLPEQPHKYTYMHIIYSPISIRLIDIFLAGKITPQLQTFLNHDTFYSSNLQNQGQKGRYQKVKQNTLIYLYFIGGVTQSQIDCLRILQKMYQVQFIICTTNLIQGNRLIRAGFQYIKVNYDEKV